MSLFVVVFRFSVEWDFRLIFFANAKKFELNLLWKTILFTGYLPLYTAFCECFESACVLSVPESFESACVLSVAKCFESACGASVPESFDCSMFRQFLNLPISVLFIHRLSVAFWSDFPGEAESWVLLQCHVHVLKSFSCFAFSGSAVSPFVAVAVSFFHCLFFVSMIQIIHVGKYNSTIFCFQK